jgi:hypothetical protein
MGETRVCSCVGERIRVVRESRFKQRNQDAEKLKRNGLALLATSTLIHVTVWRARTFEPSSSAN